MSCTGRELHGRNVHVLAHNPVKRSIFSFKVHQVKDLSMGRVKGSLVFQNTKSACAALVQGSCLTPCHDQVCWIPDLHVRRAETMSRAMNLRALSERSMLGKERSIFGTHARLQSRDSCTSS